MLSVYFPLLSHFPSLFSSQNVHKNGNKINPIAQLVVGSLYLVKLCYTLQDSGGRRRTAGAPHWYAGSYVGRTREEEEEETAHQVKQVTRQEKEREEEREESGAPGIQKKKRKKREKKISLKRRRRGCRLC